MQSYEEALSTLELAERLGLGEPVVRAADLLVYPVLLRDRQAMTDLVLSALGPLRDARGARSRCCEHWRRTSSRGAGPPRRHAGSR